MVKFKKGDKVRVIGSTRANLKTNQGIIVGQYETSKECWIVQADNYWGTNEDVGGKTHEKSQHVDPSDLELISEPYQKITPKVGERYRVVKELVGVADIGKYFLVTSILEIIRTNDEWGDEGSTHKCLPEGASTGWQILEKCFTTEYLELVEEPGKSGTPFRAAYLSEMPYAPFDMSGTIRQIAEYSAQHYINKQPIKKTLIQKTMNAFKKAMLSATTKTFIKAGFIDEETLEPTCKGKEALDFILWTANEKALLEVAEANIKEAEAKK